LRTAVLPSPDLSSSFVSLQAGEHHSVRSDESAPFIPRRVELTISLVLPLPSRRDNGEGFVQLAVFPLSRPRFCSSKLTTLVLTFSLLPKTVKSFYQRHLFAETAPVPGAFESLVRAKNSIPGLEFVIVTARGEPERLGSQIWVDKFYPGVFRELYFTGAL